MAFKDYFSQQAAQYAQYRPRYPAELFAWLASITPRQAIAWDCGTGNGQVALSLAPYFEQIIATDASQAQIDHAFSHEKITYYVAGAEKSNILANSVDLITVAQAIHWFKLAEFYAEARRVLTQEGIIAIWGYGAFTILKGSEQGINLVKELVELVEPYWPPEIQLIREGYKTVDFPFVEIECPEFSLAKTLAAEELVGYFASWSATQKLREAKGGEFVEKILTELLDSLASSADKSVHIHWPIYLRVGKNYDI